MNWIRSIVLDIDQLLVDSRDAHARAWVDALQSFGIHMLVRRVRPLIGLDPDTLLRRLTGIPESSPAGRRITQSRWLIYRSRYLPVLRPHSEARRLLDRLAEEGLRIAIGTTGSETDLQLMMDAAEVGDLAVTRVATGHGVRRATGGLYQAAAGALCEPAPCLAAIVDTPHEVAGALRARLTPIALRSGGWDERTLDGAAAIYDDLSDLLSQYETTPLGSGCLESALKLGT